MGTVKKTRPEDPSSSVQANDAALTPAHPLAENEKLFQFVLQNNTDIITVFDRTGRILYQSPSIRRVLGRDPEKRIGQNIFDSVIVHPDDRKSKQDFLYKLMRQKPDKQLKGEFRLQHANGSYRDIEAIGVNLLDDPSFGAVILSSRDTTERKAAEVAAKRQHQLEARAALLLEQHKQLLAINTVKDEFVSLASHQLRTPATGVKQYVAMILEGYAGPITPAQRKYLKRAYACNERQLKIVDALLNVAQLDAGKVQLDIRNCNLTKLLSDILEDHHPIFTLRNQTLALEAPPIPVHAWIDQHLLRMAVENLIDNAGKYSPDGKAITIHLRQRAQQTEIAICDQGVGITKKNQALLFQKFSRLSNPLSISAGGSGLGLYWTKKIIELHDGTITITSRLHHGSTFTITLPAVANIPAKS